MAHNYYQQPGGEDKSFAAEASTLEAHGHTVYRYTKHNDAIKTMSKLTVARKTLWNDAVYQELRELFQQQRFDIAHFQNTFPLISPAAYAAAQDSGVPVVQSLRNFRLVCPSAIFFRDGRICMDCVGKTPPLPGVIHACYRGSRVQTGMVATMLTFHRLRGTYDKQIDRYICLTESSKGTFVEAGFDPAKIVVKPNFLGEDPGYSAADGDYIIFVGRMAPEKGVWTVLNAWLQTDRSIPLKIVGDGPEFAAMQHFVTDNNLGAQVDLLGRKDYEETKQLIKGAVALIFPSEWYETFGRVAIEAFACGVPVIASDFGSMAELVTDGETGYHFKTGDAGDLAAKVAQMWARKGQLSPMKQAARAAFDARYTAARNYEMMINIYGDVIKARNK